MYRGLLTRVLETLEKQPCKWSGSPANFDQIEETMDLSFIFDGMSIFSEAHN